jgi:hypothetical protein
LCANKTCLIRLRYHKRFGGKTEFKFNWTRAKQVFLGVNLMKLLG